MVVVVALVMWLKGSCRVAALVSLVVVFLVSLLAVAAVVVVEVEVTKNLVVAAAIVVLVLAVVVFLAVLVVVRHQYVGHLPAVLDVPSPTAAAVLEAVFWAGVEAGPCRWGHSSGAPWFNIG